MIELPVVENEAVIVVVRWTNLDPALNALTVKLGCDALHNFGVLIYTVGFHERVCCGINESLQGPDASLADSDPDVGHQTTVSRQVSDKRVNGIRIVEQASFLEAF